MTLTPPTPGSIHGLYPEAPALKLPGHGPAVRRRLSDPALRYRVARRCLADVRPPGVLGRARDGVGPGRETRAAPASRVVAAASPQRQGVHQPAPGPEVVQPARQADRGAAAERPLEHLPVVPHLPDDLVGPALLQAERLAEARCAEHALDVRVPRQHVARVCGPSRVRLHDASAAPAETRCLGGAVRAPAYANALVAR